MPVHAADLADDGTIRRRVSGRTRSGKLQHNPGQYAAAPLYTVVTMDPNDEVCHWQGYTILFCFGTVCVWFGAFINCVFTMFNSFLTFDSLSLHTLCGSAGILSVTLPMLLIWLFDNSAAQSTA